MLDKNLFGALTLSTALFLVSPLVLASGDHDHGHGNSHAHEDTQNQNKPHAHDQMPGMFLKKKTIDGYDVSFHVMEAQEGMKHGGSHNFMIKIEEKNKVLGDVVINSKVIHPNGQEESKMLMKMGDWYMNGYDLGHDGKHQLLILFKTPDGKKHKGGIYYP